MEKADNAVPQGGAAAPASGAEPQAQPIPAALNTFIGDDGKFKEGWHEAFVERGVIPKDFADDLNYKTFTDLHGLMKQFGHQSKMIGKDKITVPGEKATPTEIAEFYKKLGVPDSVDGYKFTPPDELKDFYKPETLNPILERVRAKGATPAVVSEFLAIDSERAKAALKMQAEADTKAEQDTEATLKKEFPGEQYDSMNRMISRLVATVVPEADRQPFVEFARKNPAVARALHMLAKNTLDDKPVNTDGEGGAPPAADEIETLMRTPGYLNGKLRESNRAEHERITEKLNWLHKKKYGAEQK
jgi:hypothetical protein